MSQSIVRYSYHNPVETYETNVMGTLNILEGIRSIDTVKAAIMVTTDKCYHNDGRRQGYREDDPLGGHDPYSSSKAAAEILISSYRDSYFTSYDSEINTALASVRAGNVIGGGDWAEDRLIPDIVRSFQDGKMVVIRNPYSVRPWQHVLDPLYGYMYLAESLVNDPKKYSSGWNFGPVSNDSKTVQWIVEEMAKKWGDKTNWVVDDSVQPHEADYLTLDCERANKILNWMPKWNINDALHKIIEWHKLEHSGENCRKICIEQINEYMGS
jgi:CDP-glucose 4,6-dehydratase